MNGKMRLGTHILVLAIASLGLALLAACGPTYPACQKDGQCASHKQVCVDQICSQCRDDTQCAKLGACGACTSGHVCAKRQGCCTTDADCPGGRCWKDGDAKTGICGGQCRTKDDCPAGQTCSGGSCVPDLSCTTDADCKDGKKCINGTCSTPTCSMEPLLFDFNEYAVRLDQESALQANAACAKLRSGDYQIAGNCDERGSEEYNLALGQRRANVVAKAYETAGVAKSRLSTISYGEEKPVCTEGTEACWQKNRRVDTTSR